MSQEMFYEEINIPEILEEYHRRQLLENLCGPALSLATHIIVLALMFTYMITSPPTPPPAIEVSIIEEQIKEIEDPEIFDEFVDEEIEETTIEENTQDPSDANEENMGENVSVDDFSDEAPSTDDNIEDFDVLDVISNKSPLTMDLGGGMANRGKKGDSLKKYGGNPRGLNAVNKALAWLARVQNTDGSWGASNEKAAYTGMALLVFLAHGETPLSERYGNTVQKAIKWLATAVNESNDGRLGRAYSHGIATYALCESYAMTRIPFLRSAMEKALSIIIYGQQDGGGFDYRYKKGARWDNSVAGWQFQALKAGYVAGATNEGLEEAIRKAILFERRTAYKSGKFGYSKAGSGGNMTGVGVVTLQLLGAGNCAEVKQGVKTIASERLRKYEEIAKDPSKWDAVAGKCMYGWYYDTMAMFNCNAGDARQKKLWKAWRPVFERVLLRHQQPEGYWEVAKGHGMGPNLNGRILATCWSALQLEVYYRFLPTFDIEKMNKHVVSDIGGGDLEKAGDGDGLIIEID